jgi:2-polyprenyl-3-methyl-5-hydroxy-6-metoxy-1,4-benzoquinol methylase
MPIFPLDAVRNATISREIEPVLEDLRGEVLAFPFGDMDGFGGEEALAAYDLARPRLNVLASLLRDMRGKRGADISVGPGFLSVLLARHGLTVIGTESEIAVARFAAAHGVELRPFEIGREAPPFLPASLDFLILGEVLEHLKLPPVPVVRELAGLVRPGGRFILTTPNVARLQHLEALLAGDNFLEPFPEEIPWGADATDFVEHVREYSVREVVEAAEAASLVVDRVVMTGWGEAGYNLLPNPFVNEIIVLVATQE